LRHWMVVAACLGVLGAAELASAQAVVQGDVVDEKGQAVEGASVTLQETDNGWSYDAESDAKGHYQLAVRPGRYQITVEKDGYRGTRMDRPISRKGLELEPVEIVSAKTLMEAALGELNARFAKAATLAQEGKLDEAQAVFESLLADRPDLVDAQYNLGLVLVRKNEPEKAIAALEKALEMRPDHAPAAMALADVFQGVGRTDEASALVAKTAGEHPDDAAIQVEAAYLYLDSDRHEEAQPYLERALAAAPDNAEAHYLLGTVLARKGEFTRAVELLERYLELAPADDRYRSAAEGMLPQLKELVAKQAGQAQP